MPEADEQATESPPTMDLDGPPPTVIARLALGTTLGRYLVTGLIGEGGAGIVYAAYDPELDRKLAIKLVRPLAQTQARLLREAQAMARVSHPNVVVVHDVGTFGDRVFVAMEFVDGWTLRDWIRLERRTWRQVLDVVVAAGRGLAAAHEAGFVHRDFKPDNVLISRDGNVRVTDFGLVRAGPESAAESAPDAAPAAGAIAGTPGYMPPEQYGDTPPDPRADQFSFCATLFEALYDRRCFVGESTDAMREATLAGRLPSVDRAAARVPARVHRAIVRGLSVDPAVRFASMNALLAELGRDPGARWRRVFVAGAAALSAIAIAWGVHASSARQEQLCRGAEASLLGVWDAAARDRARASFAATGQPYAGRAFEGAATQIDRYAADWVAMRTESCEAARVRGDQSDAILTLRTTCLDTRLRELRSLVEVMSSADRGVVDAAVQAAGRLSAVAACGDLAALTAPIAPPADAGARNDVDALRGRLASVRARASAGKLAEAIADDTALLEDARRTGYAPLVAEGLLDLGAAHADAGNYDDAARVLREAVEVSEEARHDDARGQALVHLAEVTGRWQGHYAEAAEYALTAVHVARRIGDDRLEGFALEQASREHGFMEDLDRSLDEARRAVAMTERTFGADDLRRAAVDNSIAVSLAELGRFDEAERNDRLALEIAERALGPTHPSLRTFLNDLALDLVWSGRPADAVPLDERAAAIVLDQLGPDSPRYADALNNLAYAEIAVGRFADSYSHNERSLAIFERAFGPSHAENAYPLLGMGQALLGTGDPAGALPLLERATDLAEANAIDAMDLGDCRFDLARAIWDAGPPATRVRDRARAVALAEKARVDYGRAPRLAAYRARVDDWLEAHRAAGAGSH
jgi:tetratricopeptide (TPR) repeat protein